MENEQKFAAVPDIPTCKLCGYKALSIQSHLKTHSLTVAQYYNQYNATVADVYHTTYTDQKRARISGDKNPGYQHGGKMSSFSKHYAKYEGMTSEEKEAAINNQIKKANNTKRQNNSYTTTVEYYTSKGFTEEEAEHLRKQRQMTFSLEKCIEKYGEKDGYKRWMARQQKWLDSEGMKTLCFGVSRISQEMFDAIADQYDGQCIYATNGADGVNNEHALCTSKGYVKPDFFAPGDPCKIIEFDGDYWHSEKNPHNVCSETRDDKIKKSFPSYQILHIYERDYRKDKVGTIQKCLDFLNS